MKFGILVNASPYTHQACDSAYHFARASLAKGHTVSRIFFYHDGVYSGSDLLIPPQDERNIAARWSALADEYGVDLVLCVAAAQRRGVLDESEAKRHEKKHHNVANGFRISGLGQLMETSIEVDRLLVFGN